MSQTSGEKPSPEALGKKIPDHAPQRILLVDDDTQLLGLYSRVLTGSGYHVDTAENGEVAWEKLHAVLSAPSDFDLLITDNEMPKLEGIELIKKMRSEGMTLPIILASGGIRLHGEYRHLAESLQIAAILPKPFPLHQLVKTVKEILHWSTVVVNGKNPRK